MASESAIFSVGAVDRVFVQVDDGATTILYPVGGTLYYGDKAVTSSSNDGSVASGSSVSLTTDKWLIASALTRIVAITTPGAGVALTGTNTWTGEATFDEGITLSDAGATAAKGIAFSTDTNLYRSAANTLKTDDAFTAASLTSASSIAGGTNWDVFSNGTGQIISALSAAHQVALTRISSAAGITFGSAADTNLYRSAADTLRTDDALVVQGAITGLGSIAGGSGWNVSAAGTGNLVAGDGGAGQVVIGVGVYECSEISDPAAPAANGGKLYFRDSGGGKTQLCARFATGAVQVVATEP